MLAATVSHVIPVAKASATCHLARGSRILTTA
jgi:hypothetical protein